MYFQKYDSEKMWVFRNSILLVVQQGGAALAQQGKSQKGIRKGQNVRKPHTGHITSQRPGGSELCQRVKKRVSLLLGRA